MTGEKHWRNDKWSIVIQSEAKNLSELEFSKLLKYSNVKHMHAEIATLIAFARNDSWYR